MSRWAADSGTVIGQTGEIGEVGEGGKKDKKPGRLAPGRGCRVEKGLGAGLVPQRTARYAARKEASGEFRVL